MTTQQRETLQYIFDFVASHLMEQGVKSATDGGHCLYSGPDGARCAVGCLLIDGAGESLDKFSPSLLSIDMGSFEPMFTAGFLRNSLPENPLLGALLSSLQVVHDDHKPSDWVEMLLNAANNNNLDPGILVAWA